MQSWRACFPFPSQTCPRVPNEHPAMKSPVIRRMLFGCVAAFLVNLSLPASEVEAIASKTARDYVRKELPDGTFQPETYAFGKGDNMSGARVDATADSLDFMAVARAVSVPLAEKRYLPTQDPKATQELIMVYWGTTRAPESATESNSHILAQQANDMRQRALLTGSFSGNTAAPASVAAVGQKEVLAEADNAVLVANLGVQQENQRREDQDMKTATLLGYDSWWVSANAAMDGTAMGLRKADMRAELEEDRYFVVLTAFDYQMLANKKKSRFLWEVRFSIREHGNQFDRRLPAMIALASDYFGRDSQGLHHVDVPEGKVEIGPVRSLGVVAPK
jgi:hypothetical protein